MDILSPTFDVLIYDVDYFVAQIPIVIGTKIDRIEIDVDRDETNDIKWRETNISLVDNAISKHNKRVPDCINKEEKVNKLTDFTIGDFLDEQQLIVKWKELNPSDYEKFLRIVGDYEKTVETLCIINTDDNNALYEKIKLELGTLAKPYLDISLYSSEASKKTGSKTISDLRPKYLSNNC